jgi:co-chaperonin GroES (HSP10)
VSTKMPESKKSSEPSTLVGRNGERPPFAVPTMLPIGEQVIIQRKPASDKTPAGLVLVNAAKETPLIGTVIAVGPGQLRGDCKDGQTERYPMQVKVGDKVLLPYGIPGVLLDERNEDSEIVVCPERALLAIFAQDAQ